ncbi:MAG: hypothetical protein H0T51_24495 [Pirellulales bacterium]|nr:hypothetical protein [Pirellulales bacterium]
MLGLNDMLLGGLVPLVAAALAFSIGWAASRRPAVAQSAGVIFGYAAGVTALEARNSGISVALAKLVEPTEAREWAPLIGLVAIVPGLAAALGKRAWIRWLLAATLCGMAPLWLLWGSKYLPSQADRASGFVTTAWGGMEAALMLTTFAALLLVAWRLWESADSTAAPRGRSLLAIIAVTGGAAATGLTGSFVYAQLFGVLAASLGGCFVAGLLLKANAGPEAAAGPTIVLAGCLLLLAACYSELRPWQAAGVWASIIMAAGWLPWLSRLPSKRQLAVRAIACLLPLSIVVCLAGLEFAETQRQQQEERASNPYLNL